METAESTSGSRRLPVPSAGMLFISAVVLLALAIGLSIFVPHAQKLRLLNHLGSLGYLGDVETEFHGPAWLAGYTGESDRAVFAVVTELTCYDATNETLKLAASQPYLKIVRVIGSDVDADGLQHLGRSDQLTELELMITSVDDDALAALSNQSHLERLLVIDCPIDGTGFEHLRHLPALKTLDVSLCPVTDEGLWYISWLEHLEILDLRATSITNAGLRHLERLPSLSQVNVSRTAVGDEGIESLAKVLALRNLKTSPGQFSEEGRAHLHQLRPDITVSTE